MLSRNCVVSTLSKRFILIRPEVSGLILTPLTFHRLLLLINLFYLILSSRAPSRDAIFLFPSDYHSTTTQELSFRETLPAECSAGNPASRRKTNHFRLMFRFPARSAAAVPTNLPKQRRRALRLTTRNHRSISRP